MYRRLHGFTLLEVVFGLLLIAIGVIATAPLFIYATQENAAGGDLGNVGAAAERQILLTALERNDWHITHTAEELGLADHSSLHKILRRLGIQRPE